MSRTSPQKTGISAENEDTIIVTPDFIGIFDGSSLAKDETLEGMSGGRFASTNLAGIVQELPAGIDNGKISRECHR